MRLNLKHFTRKLKHSHIFFLLALGLWFIIRVGTRPTRVMYPCQQTFLAYISSAFQGIFAPLLVIIPVGFKSAAKTLITRRNFAIVAVLFVAVLSGTHFLEYEYPMIFANRYEAGSLGSVTGIPITGFAVMDNYPNRVVSIHSSNATSWDFGLCDYGPCAYYYGDDAYVDQAVVDNMIDRGLMELTGTTNIADAWNEILPNYSIGEGIAIKVNFNDACWGGGDTSPPNTCYDDNDSYVDAIPQPVNSLIRGMKLIGVQEQDIWIYDASRYITDRFRNRIHYPNVRYYDGNGGRPDVERTGFDSTDPTANIDFSLSGYPGSQKITDILVDATYLINIPIFKRHGGAGITLSLKNHFGTIPSPGSLHNYVYLSGSSYDSNVNPTVDINANTHIKDKTVLIVGEGLYGTWPNNNIAPRPWTSFGDDSPNIIFFGVDPIATDSVMYDYLVREGSFDSRSEDVLIVGAAAGLGIHERWNNDIDRQYTAIDYIEMDFDTMQILNNEIFVEPPTLTVNQSDNFTINIRGKAPVGASDINSIQYDIDYDDNLLSFNSITEGNFLSNGGGNGTFQPAVNYDVGFDLGRLVLGDFDGDGDKDIAIANVHSSSVSILLNNNDATFQAPVTYGVGSGPWSLSSSDFNNDNYDDLAVANRYGDSVSVLLSNGDGTFQTKVDYPTGDYASSVFSADFNNDNYDDIAVANMYSNNVSVLLNNLDGTFQTTVNYPAGISPAAISSGDFNNDNYNDLVVGNGGNFSNSSGDSVSILFNNGDGTFQSVGDYPGGHYPYHIFSSDLDGDNYDDVLVISVHSSSVSILFNNGDGTFQDFVDYGVGGWNSEVFSGDFDGDGDNDIATARTQLDDVAILINNGDRTFQPPVYYPVGDYPTSVFSRDLDGDGDNDLAVPNYNSQNVSILLNDGGSAETIFNYNLSSGRVSVYNSRMDSNGVYNDLATFSIIEFIAVNSGVSYVNISEVIWINSSGGNPELIINNGTVTIILSESNSIDVNTDGIVNIIDLVLVIFHQGIDSSNPNWDDYDHLDVNTDNTINFTDVSAVISNFG